MAPDEELGLAVVVPRAFEVTGRVTLDGRSLPTAQVEISSLDPEHPGVATLGTDQDGNFSTRLRRSGEYSFKLLKTGANAPSLQGPMGPGIHLALDFD